MELMLLNYVVLRTSDWIGRYFSLGYQGSSLEQPQKWLPHGPTKVGDWFLQVYATS